MAYRTRSARRLVSKTRRNFFVTLLVIFFLIFVTFNWVLPAFINSLGFITSPFKQVKDKEVPVSENPALAPPVLNIPYEATNTAKINVEGFATTNSKVRIFVDDGEKGEEESESDGSFQVKNIELNLGTNSIYGKTIDEKGKESLPSKIIKLIYDNENPTLEVSEPSDGKEITGDRKLKISGKTESSAKVFISVTNVINEAQIIVDSEGKFTSDQNLNDGENIFTIKAMDSASNQTEVVRRVVFKP